MQSSGPKLRLDRRIPAAERTSGLFKHFKTVSPEEHLENIRKEDERITELRTKTLEQQTLVKTTRKNRKRELARIRKQRQRERERQKEIGLVEKVWTHFLHCLQ